MILYECLTGEVPFPGDSFIEVLRNLVKGTFDPPRKYAPEISEELEAIVLRTLDQDPAKRFPSMRHLARALLPYASPRGRAVWSDAFEEGGATPSEVQVLSSSDLVEVKPAKTWLLVAGVAAILLGAGGLAWRMLQSDPEVPEAIVEAPVVTPEVVQATPTPPEVIEAPTPPTPTVEETAPNTEDAPPPGRVRPSVGAEETPITTPVEPPEVTTPEVRPETHPHPPVEHQAPTEPEVPVGANGAVIVD